MNIHLHSISKRQYSYRVSNLLPSLALLLPTQVAVFLGPKSSLHPLILVHDILYTSPIMFRFPHVRQSGPSRSFLLPLHHFYALHVRTVDLVPHFHADPRQLVSQQDSGIDTPTSDIDAHSCKGFAIFQAYKKNITDFGAFGIAFREEVCSRARGV